MKTITFAALTGFFMFLTFALGHFWPWLGGAVFFGYGAFFAIHVIGEV